MWFLRRGLKEAKMPRARAQVREKSPPPPSQGGRVLLASKGLTSFPEGALSVCSLSLFTCATNYTHTTPTVAIN